jgi:BirA family biotin operon repressor/biotin-[acetyl-CoA-carboxylase] ligase
MRELDFDTRLIGRRVRWFERVDSTNTLAAAHADERTNDGLVFVADEQTAGRGRAGRTWLSPPGCGLLMSVLLFPPEHVRQPVPLTVLAAVSVCEAIDHCTGLEANIKWPNDVLIRGRKVCGILVEQGRGTVIGVGLNVNTPAEAFAAVELPQAGSLRLFAGEVLDREAIARVLIQALDAGYQALLSGQTGDLESRWRAHSDLVGRQVLLSMQNGTQRGKVVDLSFTGVILQDAGGEVRRFVPELVQQITPT